VIDEFSFVLLREIYDDMTMERGWKMEDMDTSDLKIKMRWGCDEKAWIIYLVFRGLNG